MSRIGKSPIAIPEGVTVEIKDNVITVKGKLGELSQNIDEIAIKNEDGTIILERPSESKEHKSKHGLYRALINNMIQGVNTGWTKDLELVGVEVTGIIYKPDVNFGSTGGIISGNDTISLGNSTGPLNLSLYNGNILTWQRKINNGDWSDILGTTGLDVFEETPTVTGLCKYRVKVQYNSCPEVFSDSLELKVVTTIELNLKIYLEGAYASQQMLTTLNSSGLLPLFQPYNIPPWYYNGGENVSDIPNTEIVDWILVEIRETEGDASSATNEKTVGVKAGFLLNNGQITDINGSSKLTFTSAFIDNHFIIIWHRNHLGIISSQPILVLGGIYFYDFTTGAGKVLGGAAGYIELESNIWGLASGDSNGDQIVNISDKVDSWESFAGIFGYIGGDLNLDGQVNNQDKNDTWFKNVGIESQVP